MGGGRAEERDLPALTRRVERWGCVSFVDFSDQVGPRQRGLWNIRKEASESWDHCTSNEAVYIGQPVTGNSSVPIPFSKLYLRGDAWLK